MLACMLIMTWAGRESTRDLSVFQAMEIRSLIGLVLLSPLVWRAGGLAAMATRRPLAHVGRNVAHYSGQYAWVAALSMIPIAQVIAIEFTTPIWTAVFATTLLGERLTVWKTVATVLGLLGVLVIVRPGGTYDPGQLVVLFAAFAFGVSATVTKSLTGTEPVVRIIFWMLVVQSLIGLVPALWTWRDPAAAAWPHLLLFAFGGTFAHYCMARALTHADATAVMPMDFVRVPASALLGWAVYAESVDALTMAGAAFILFGNLLNLVGRKPKAQEPVAP